MVIQVLYVCGNRKRKQKFNLRVNKIKSKVSLEWLVVFCCLLIFAGLVSSRAVISVGMIVLVLVVLWHNGIKNTLSAYCRPGAQTLLLLLFLLVFVSGLWSNDKTEWLSWVRIKLPYLFIPLSFAGLKQFNPKQFAVILYGFVLAIVGSTFLVLANYALHYQEINQSFLSGGGIPVPFSHIRHTLMLSFGFAACIFMLENKLIVFHVNEKWLQLFLAIFSFVALHILTVRSGLLALYIGSAVYLIHFVASRKKYVLGAAITGVLMTLLCIAYISLPSLQNKIKYMKYDLELYQNGQFANTNDGVRLVSLQVGLEVWKQNAWLGTGAGDLKAACMKVFDEKYPDLNDFSRKLPHNQFLWVLSSCGAFAFLLFVMAVVSPLFIQPASKNWLYIAFHLMILSSFLFEHTLEEQIGTGFYVLMFMVLIKHPDQTIET